MTQRDGMGREEGGGIRMGNTCISVVDHVDIWQNQYNIVKLKNKHTHTHTHKDSHDFSWSRAYKPMETRQYSY